MMQKIIFMDIDGTLVNHYGVIPPSASFSIQKARQNGHLVFICTGRSKAELFPEILEVGFDGIIGSAGGYIEIEGEVLVHERVKIENIQHLVTFFNKHCIDFYLESNGGLFASRNCKKHIRAIIEKMILENSTAKEAIEKGLQPFHDLLIENQQLVRGDINKISFLGSDIPFEIIKKEFQSTFQIVPSTVPAFGENSGELSIPNIHKATAIQKLIAYLNLSQKNTYAYGDGVNDMEMLRFVQYGIAMGNAEEAVKKIADDVTSTSDDNGIFNSFKKYSLI